MKVYGRGDVHIQDFFISPLVGDEFRESLLPIGWSVGWAPEQVWMIGRSENS
jgi:hypothetical protein